ncbi:hypothetical protein AMELA_G00232850, partial [Ameiurus melas]
LSISSSPSLSLSLSSLSLSLSLSLCDLAWVQSPQSLNHPQTHTAFMDCPLERICSCRTFVHRCALR